MRREVTVWNPWRMAPFDESDLEQWGISGAAVNLDLYEEGDNVVVKLEAPGFDKESIDIQIESNMLTLKGNTREISEEEDRKRKYYRKEISQRSFSRTAELPSAVDANKASAIFKDGILTINLPKKEEAKPKKISIDVE